MASDESADWPLLVHGFERLAERFGFRWVSLNAL